MHNLVEYVIVHTLAVTRVGLGRIILHLFQNRPRIQHENIIQKTSLISKSPNLYDNVIEST